MGKVSDSADYVTYVVTLDSVPALDNSGNAASTESQLYQNTLPVNI